MLFSRSFFLTWGFIIIMAASMVFPQLQTRWYMVPCVMAMVYIFFNEYPQFARRMHQRKLTYEDLEDFRDVDPELRRRFQVVFTRVQQFGGAICGGILVLYAFHVFDHSPSVFEFFGILGGILSLYARLFGYIGSFCITCLYSLKKKQESATCELTRMQKETTHTYPYVNKPENTKCDN